MGIKDKGLLFNILIHIYFFIKFLEILTRGISSYKMEN